MGIEVCHELRLLFRVDDGFDLVLFQAAPGFPVTDPPTSWDKKVVCCFSEKKVDLADISLWKKMQLEKGIALLSLGSHGMPCPLSLVGPWVVTPRLAKELLSSCLFLFLCMCVSLSHRHMETLCFSLSHTQTNMYKYVHTHTHTHNFNTRGTQQHHFGHLNLLI